MTTTTRHQQQTTTQSIETLCAELEALHRQPSPLAAAQAAKQEVLGDQRKFQEVIAGNTVSCVCSSGVRVWGLRGLGSSRRCQVQRASGLTAADTTHMTPPPPPTAQAQRASLAKKLEERQADLEAKKAALAAVRAG